ncbi:MAG: phosphoribosylformylglycinamidine synthase subunit PurS [Ignavibacteriaceae bacterium]
MFKVKVVVRRRKSILDPWGKAVEKGAKLLGIQNIQNVRIDKQIDFLVDAKDEASASAEVKLLCDKLLANPIMEDYEFNLERVDGN